MGMHNHHTAWEEDRFWVSERKDFWSKSVNQQQKTLWRWRLKTVSKQFLYHHELKGYSWRRKALLHNHYKKARIQFANAQGDMSCGLTKPLANDKLYIWRKKGEALKPQNTTPTVKYRGGSIMLWSCFAAKGTHALHKVDGILRKENYLDILKQHLKTSARKMKLGRKWVFQN